MPRKKHLSGAQSRNQHRKNRRKRLLSEGVVLNPVRIRHLDNVEDFQNEVARLYRRAARGEMLIDDASKLAYILKTGGELARYREDREHIKQLMAQLSEVQSTGARVALIPAPTDDDPNPDEIPLNTLQDTEQ